MTNFWPAYKRDFWKVAALAMITVVLSILLGRALSHIRLESGSALLEILRFFAMFKTKFLYFAFYCACAALYFGADKGRFTSLLAKYFYVPVIWAALSFAIAKIYAYVNVYIFTNNIQLMAGKYQIPYSWVRVPFTILDGFIAVLIIFALFIAVSRAESWPKAFGIFLGRYKALFLAFCWWQICISLALVGAGLAYAYIYSLITQAPAYTMVYMTVNMGVSLILEAIVAYFIFQKTGIAGAD